MKINHRPKPEKAGDAAGHVAVDDIRTIEVIHADLVPPRSNRCLIHDISLEGAVPSAPVRWLGPSKAAENVLPAA